MSKEISRSRKAAAKAIYAALTILKDYEDGLPYGEVVKEVEKNVDFSDWEKEVYETSGLVRWHTFLSFYSTSCVKAGFLLKKKGKWYLTDEGEKALELGEKALLDKVSKRYKEWDRNRKKEKPEIETESDESESDIVAENSISRVDHNELLSIAIEQIKAYLDKKNAYEFQDIVAALLRAMGYYTPFVAPRGKDGGIDVIAYKDPLGTVPPRIKVQVKHRQNSASVMEIRQLIGILREGDVGIFISTGGFTPDAKATALNSHIHVELIDLEKFITLWQEFYEKMDDEDKVLLPLQPIYFIAEVN